MRDFRLGLLGPTNRCSGLGLVNWDLFRHAPVHSVLAVVSPKGNDVWHKRQTPFPYYQFRGDAAAIRTRLNTYYEMHRPDVMLAPETYYHPCVTEFFRARGVKLVLIPMHEVYRPGAGEVDADLYLCPNRFCYLKVRGDNKALWPLPIDADDFEYRRREGKAKTLLHAHGYGYLNEKRQTNTVLSAFAALSDFDWKMILASQASPQKYASVIRADARIEKRGSQKRARDVYRNVDALIQPEAYAGYGRVPLEAMVQGIPVVTTAAPPMNELVPPELLVPYERSCWIDRRGGLNVTSWIVAQNDMIDKLRWLAGADLGPLSDKCRAVALKHVWTPKRERELRRFLQGVL